MRIWIGAFSGFICLVCAAGAVDSVWNGGGSDAMWKTAGNWGGTPVAAGNDLYFGGTANLVNTNDWDEGTAFASITFTNGAGAFVLNGNGIALGGSVANSDNDIQTINLPMALAATQIFNATGGAITVTGTLSGPGGLTKAGTKALTLGCSNSYEGVTTIAAGRVSITDSSALGSSAQGTVVNTGAGVDIYNGLSIAEPITLINQNSGSMIFQSGSNVYSGQITITGGQARIQNQSMFAHITGGITSINSAVILDTGSAAGTPVLRISEKPILAGTQKTFVHGSRTAIFAVAGNIFNNLEVSGGSLLLEVPNAWPANLTLEVGVSYAINSFIDLQGNDQTVGSLTGVITNNGIRAITSSTGPATLTVNQSGTTEYNSNFASQLRLVKLGTGQLTVSGTNCLQSGQTVIGGGKLRILSEKTLGVAPDSFVADQLVISNGASLLATGPCVLDDATRGITLGAGNGAFETASGADMTVSNAVTGAGGLTKSGAGTLVLAGANDYAGVTAVSAGTLQVGQKVSLYNGSPLTSDHFAVNSGATLSLNVGGTGEFTSSDVSTIAALGTATTGFKPGSWLALNPDNAPQAAYTVGNVIGNPAAGHGLNLQKLGNGTLELTGLNTYTGATKITQGVLSVNSITNGETASALGMSSKLKANLVFAGGTLRYTGPSARTDRGFTYAVNTNVYAFEVTQPGTTLTFGSISNATFDSGNTIIRKTGPGTLTFGKSYPSGGHGNYPVKAIHLLEGTMRVDIAGNTVQQNLYCAASNGPALLLGDGVELTYDTPLERSNDRLVQYVGTQTCARLTAGALTLCGPDSYPANVHTFDIKDGADEIDLLLQSRLGVFPSATAISDFVKAGAGTLKLGSNQNAYRGATVIRSGRLLVGGSISSNAVSYLGQSSNVVQFCDALSQPSDTPALLFEGTNNSAFTCNRSLRVYQAGESGTVGSLSNVNLTLSGPITVSNTLQLLSVTAGTNALFITGGIGGPGGVTASGTGTVILAARNTYTGATTLAAGVLRLVSDELIADASPLRLTGGQLTLNGFNETMGALDVDGASVIDFAGGNSTLTLADSAGEAWSGTLLLRNWNSGSDHLYVGTSSCLSEAQLAKITSPSGQTATQLSSGEVLLLPLGTLILLR